MKLNELVELINDCQSDVPPAEHKHSGIGLTKEETVSDQELDIVIRACATDKRIYTELARRVNWIRATNQPLDEEGRPSVDPHAPKK